jgi:hypothetical protein
MKLFILSWLFLSGILKAQDRPKLDCISPTAIEVSEPEVAVNTGDRRFDDLISDELEDIATTFHLNISVYVWTNVPDVNSCFTPNVYPELIKADGGDLGIQRDGSIFVTMPLLRETGDDEVLITAQLVHEYAHGLQRINGFPYKNKWKELHADYMAGWYVAHRGWCQCDMVTKAGKSFHKLGEYNFNDPNHHGTPMEREDAFYAGFNFGRIYWLSSANDAYFGGIRHFRRQGAQ